MSPKNAARCSACSSPHSDQIANAMASRRTYTWIARSFGVSPATLVRHKAHLPPDLLPSTSTYGQDATLRAIDIEINDLHRLSAAVKREKNSIEKAKMVVAISRESWKWVQLRIKVAGRTPLKPLRHEEPELSAEQAASVAAIILSRSKQKHSPLDTRDSVAGVAQDERSEDSGGEEPSP
jgi:hypothetical protein